MDGFAVFNRLSALLLPFGKLGDRIGKQRIFKWGTGTFVLRFLDGWELIWALTF
jgi:hypothetical protein